MHLRLMTTHQTRDITIGRLYVGAEFECFTLEDPVRTGPKVPGDTAIPAGTYTLTIDFSNRFQRLMPHLLDVPGFTGIRIHAGNSAADTEGCILVGKTYVEGSDRVAFSRLAYDALFIKLYRAFAAKEPITIEIIRDEQ